MSRRYRNNKLSKADEVKKSQAMKEIVEGVTSKYREGVMNDDRLLAHVVMQQY